MRTAWATSPRLPAAYVLAGADGSAYTFAQSGQPQRFPTVGNSHRTVAVLAGDPVNPSGNGFLIVTSDGSVRSVGGAIHYGDLHGRPLVAPVVGAAPVSRGYYLVAADGGVFTFGRAPFYGSLGGRRLASPIVGMAVQQGERGYWLVDAAGKVYAFGAAPWLGDMRAVALGGPIVGMVDATWGSRAGYVLGAADGGVFTFGNARFYGSMANRALRAPVTGIATTQGQGYYLVARDGGVFAFHEPFLGSVATQPISAAVVAMAPGLV